MRSPLRSRTIWIWPLRATTYRLPIPICAAPKAAEVFAASTRELSKELPVVESVATVQEHLEHVPGGRRMVPAAQEPAPPDWCNPRFGQASPATPLSRFTT